MSLDAVYLLIYESLPYISPTPMEKDIQYLKNKYGGEFNDIDDRNTICWIKPKHKLPTKEYKKLHADQLFEREDCELWKQLY